eukprot:SAG31_NODE_43761_length_265_cov_1.457831_1_plen_61_part_10
MDASAAGARISDARASASWAVEIISAAGCVHGCASHSISCRRHGTEYQVHRRYIEYTVSIN